MQPRAPTPGLLAQRQSVEKIVGPLVKVLVARRWANAALNRWTGTISALKRMVLGCCLNNVLPESLSGLGAEMDLTDAKVDRLLKKAQAAQLEGEDTGKGEVFWATHCKRVLRLSAFLSNARPCVAMLRLMNGNFGY